MPQPRCRRSSRATTSGSRLTAATLSRLKSYSRPSAPAATCSAPAAAQRLTGANPTGPVPAPVALDTAGMFNSRFAKVGDDVFIGGQPTEKALRDLKAQGVTTVVNLRTPPEMDPARIGF